jgi:dTDP-D-glucose 4,6-dehydratase
MRPFKFIDLILGRAIDLYNFGYLRRDYTFVDDIAGGIVRVYASAQYRFSIEEEYEGLLTGPSMSTCL